MDYAHKHPFIKFNYLHTINLRKHGVGRCFCKTTLVFVIIENNTIDLLAITSLHCGMRVDKQGVGEGLI
jgi:hypothetical protein